MVCQANGACVIHSGATATRRRGRRGKRSADCPNPQRVENGGTSKIPTLSLFAEVLRVETTRAPAALGFLKLFIACCMKMGLITLGGRLTLKNMKSDRDQQHSDGGNGERLGFKNCPTLRQIETFPLLLVSLLFILAGCISQRSEVANKLGYAKSMKVGAGPYQLHYGQKTSEEFVLLAEGNWDLFSRWTGEGTDVYLDGRPFVHFERSADGSVTNLSLHVSKNHGQTRFALFDRDADGQWDMKIDDMNRKVYTWKDGVWVQH